MTEQTIQAHVAETRTQAQNIHQKLLSAWWDAYTHQRDSAEALSAFQTAEAVLRQFTAAAVEKFGIKSDCETCRKNSVFGGPGHNPSPYCRSGKRPHCTCDTCF